MISPPFRSFLVTLLPLVLQRTIDPGAALVRPRVGRARLCRVWPLDSVGRVQESPKELLK